VREGLDGARWVPGEERERMDFETWAVDIISRWRSVDHSGIMSCDVRRVHTWSFGQAGADLELRACHQDACAHLRKERRGRRGEGSVSGRLFCGGGTCWVLSLSGLVVRRG
jgi:hypothetical protein